jgi:hypothetical protein
MRATVREEKTFVATSGVKRDSLSGHRAVYMLLILWCREGGSFFSPLLTAHKLLILRYARQVKNATNA